MAAQQYARASREEIGLLWVSLNQSILRVISSLQPAQLELVFLLETGETLTLQEVIRDYLAHMKHHLGQIFPDAEL